MTLGDVLVVHAGVCRAVFILGTLVAGMAVAAISSPEFRAAVLEALRRSGWTLEAAATQVRIDLSRFSKQLNGHEPLTSLSRLVALDGFWPALIDVTAPRYGCTVVRNADLAEILDLLRGGKPMAKMQGARMAAKETA